MRYFNTYGPVNEIEHYVVPRSKLVAELIAQIEQGKYFTIYAPRQMGKTTLLRSLLLSKETYLPVTLSFGGMENWPLSDFLQAFSTRYVIFHARPQVYGKLTYDQLEFTQEQDGKTIHVYLVRLGALFEKK